MRQNERDQGSAHEPQGTGFDPQLEPMPSDVWAQMSNTHNIQEKNLSENQNQNRSGDCNRLTVLVLVFFCFSDRLKNGPTCSSTYQKPNIETDQKTDCDLPV